MRMSESRELIDILNSLGLISNNSKENVPETRNFFQRRLI